MSRIHDRQRLGMYHPASVRRAQNATSCQRPSIAVGQIAAGLGKSCDVAGVQRQFLPLANHDLQAEASPDALADLLHAYRRLPTDALAADNDVPTCPPSAPPVPAHAVSGG
jgi:hypothetical protein